MWILFFGKVCHRDYYSKYTVMTKLCPHDYFSIIIQTDSFIKAWPAQLNITYMINTQSHQVTGFFLDLFFFLVVEKCRQAGSSAAPYKTTKTSLLHE